MKCPEPLPVLFRPDTGGPIRINRLTTARPLGRHFIHVNYGRIVDPVKTSIPSREASGRRHAAAVEPVRRYFRRAQQAIGDPAQRRDRHGARARDPCDVWTSGGVGQRRVLDCGPASGPGAFTRHRAADAGPRLAVDGTRRPIASVHHDGQKRSAGWSVAPDGSPLHHPQLPFRPGGIRRHPVPLAAPTPKVTSFRPESRALSDHISRLRGNRRRNTCVNVVVR